ncbi:DUF6542 domain-containing protein [Mycobacterium montefiorense]|uniref:DUF6542 domain-containing protein n=2 Tax=Mycobacterium montefiorense TaxID=154654 RepID=UPI0021F34F83|nr:DUF6542 domain-containing protein [Mycobacterium montefiorense]MCV7425948.1 hypothetical protein [Mycobacterium montefiorense]
MSAQRGTSAVEAAHRSIHPGIAGAPSWIALLIAITATAIGYGIDSGSGHKELTGIFAGFYIAGCLAGVLAVRQEGLFTAIIQPPLILFCAVPGAYWLFHGGKIGSLKDLLINCGYPLIERFPLMLGTAGVVLLIGLIRWYLATLQRTPAAADATEDNATAVTKEQSSIVRAISAKLNSLLGVASSDDEDDEETSTDSRRSSARTGRAARSARPATSSARSRSRHARPSPEDEYDPADERARRRRQPPPRDYDPADPPRRPTRRRPPTDPDQRAQSREGRRDPRSRRSPYERPAPRSGRYDGYDRYEPPVSPDSYSRFQSYQPYESYQPAPDPRRRHAGTNGTDSTHHPISQVRYRGSGPSDEHRGEPRGRSRANGRPQGRPPAESWE